MGKTLNDSIVTVCGFTGTIKEASIHFGINVNTLRTRLRMGWNLQDACTTPVEKKQGTKLARVVNVGKFTGNASMIENRFGVMLFGKCRTDGEEATRKITHYSSPKFYSIGENYKGTLKAIAHDFNCPLSALLEGVRNNMEIEDILYEKGVNVGKCLVEGGFQ